MTLIQPIRTNAWLNLILAAFLCLLVVSAVWLVSLYNRSVNVRHATAEMKEEVQRLQTENAELKGRILGILDGQKFEELAAARALVKERDPKYLETNPQWSLASR
jgi:cell division protein FtsB